MIPAHLYDKDKELQLLAALINDPFVCDTTLIDPAIFTAQIRKDTLSIINTVIRLHGDGYAVLDPELDKFGYGPVDKLDYLTDLYQFVSIPIWYWDTLLNDLTTLHKRRLQVEIAEKIAQKAINGDVGDFEKLRGYLDQVDKKTSITRVTYSLSEIAAMSFAPINYLIQDILPPGLTFLSGRPKTGKSWLSLQIATAIGNGQAVLGKKTRQGRVLYVTLEDSLRRLNSRVSKQGNLETNGVRVMLADQFESLEKSISYLSDYDLLIIDTFTRSTGSDQVDPVAMRNLLSPLQATATKLDKSVLIIDHMPKSRGNDTDIVNAIGDLYGSISKAGVADCVIGLYRDEVAGVLAGTGRDIDDFKLSLLWDKETGTWQDTGQVVDSLGYSENRLSVLACIVEAGDISQPDIASIAGLNKGTVSRVINELVSSGYVLKYPDGKRIMYQPSVTGRLDILPQWNVKAERAGVILQGSLS